MDKKTNPQDNNQKEATIRDWVDNSLAHLKQRESEALSNLSRVSRWIEQVMTAIDGIASWWLDWRLVTWQDKLKFYEGVSHSKPIHGYTEKTEKIPDYNGSELDEIQLLNNEGHVEVSVILQWERITMWNDDYSTSVNNQEAEAIIQKLQWAITKLEGGINDRKY